MAYIIPDGVKPSFIHKYIFLSTSSGGQISIDRTLLELWQEAAGRTSEEILTLFSSRSFQPRQILFALSCLLKAGLLTMHENELKPPFRSKEKGVKVSAIIVSHNSRRWLDKCLSSLLAQTCSLLDIILVENASNDDTVRYIAEEFPSIDLISLDQAQSLARALNLGIEAARGEFYLILNPDVELEPDALSYMLDIAQADDSCAAVAPKLRFSWAPAFLNGLGNFVGAISWGTDCGLGHLDLGQFDEWREVPSACFAAALIPSEAYHKVGLIDEAFPLYYEDSEWCYRARLLGYTILAAPRAIAYHAYGEPLPGGYRAEIMPTKLHQVSYGRLRFATKILGRKYLLRFLLEYLTEDLVRVVLFTLQGKWGHIHAILCAWNDFIRSLPVLIQIRTDVQAHRKRTDDDLLKLQRKTPMPLIWRGVPCLTWNIINNLYLPSIISGSKQEIPEFFKADHHAVYKLTVKPFSSLSQLIQAWRVEGFRSSLYWIGKTIQWCLIQP
jgi:GT2 family glycosyltransferase